MEAAGLRWLTAAGAVRIARVEGVGDDFIEVERLDTTAPTETAAEQFGRDLAALHDSGAPAFGCPPDGWEDDGYIGDADLPLRPEATWGRFYARHRIEPYVRTAVDDGTLTPSDARVFAALCERLDVGDFDDAAPPARIHGDLWSGNVLWTPSGVALIDPAAHGGHRLTDLAMLSLFGAPHLERIWAAYAATSSHLPPHWRDLIPLHLVHPLLVHTVLFGRGYGRQAVASARSALG